MSRAAVVVGLSLVLSCAGGGASTPAREAGMMRRDALDFLRGTLVPWPSAVDEGRLALTDPVAGRVAAYDSALVVLVLLRRGAREEAARVIRALHELQTADGAVPFSFTLPRPTGAVTYVRSGAVAWVGYAAVEYLDSASGGTARAEALTIARRAAAYVMDRQVAREGDARDGLVRGGEGRYRYHMENGELRERVEPGALEWTSTEHNVDAFFFLRALARVTGEARFSEAAARIARGLERSWSDALGQLRRGNEEGRADDVPSLDCASWGSIFLGAVGAADRADTSASVADGRYASRDPKSGARGHRMQARGPVLEAAVLMKHFGPTLPARDWGRLDVVWPEGSAGVAMAAWRVGRADRALAILEALEPLRGPGGSLPTATLEVPFVFDTKPSIAGTAWVELVRFELDRPEGQPTFWVP